MTSKRQYKRMLSHMNKREEQLLDCINNLQDRLTQRLDLSPDEMVEYEISKYIGRMENGYE